MAWEVPDALGGPVLGLELTRARQRLWPRLLTVGYLAWLLVQFLWLLGSSRDALKREPPIVSGIPRVVEYRSVQLEKQQAELRARVAFAADYVSIFLQQQLFLLLIATPAVTGGALGHEKERGTLLALLCTELTGWQIVIGKLLARLSILARPAIIGWPILFLLGGDCEFPMSRLVLALFQSAVLTFTFAAICSLTSVWTRQTRDGILACYAAIVVGYMIGVTLLGSSPIPVWLNPFEFLDRLTTPPYPEMRVSTIIVHLLFWGGVGVACLVLAITLLRWACLRQLEQRPGRWLWAFRPAVGSNPIRWRERFVIGLAPLPWLRMVPTWLARLGVFSFSVILVYTALSNVGGRGLVPPLLKGEFTFAYQILQQLDHTRVRAEVIVMGVVLLIIGTLVVGVRSATCISEEKRRKTWEDLLLTPLTLEEITLGKMWGILGSATVYLLIYTVPMVAFAVYGGTQGVVLALVFAGGTWLAMLLAATMGTNYSASAVEPTLHSYGTRRQAYSEGGSGP